MARDHQLLRYRRWYARLLRLYPKGFRERFQESMEQTFCDVCRARASAGRGFFGLALWLCVDTAGGIMNEHLSLLFVRQRSIVRAALVTVGVMLIPVSGELFVDDWNWGWQAFVVWGVLVFSAALTYQLAVKGMSSKAYRVAMGLAVATALLLFWQNFVLAVEASLANFTYFGVIVLGIVGAAIARLRARGMALALAGTAIAQMLVPFIALAFLKTSVAFGANVAGIALYAISALLFWHAARTHEMPSTH